MTDWLRGHGVTAATMEGTGVYCEAPFEALEEAGIHAGLLHAQHVKQIRRKKTDTNDSLWLARICQTVRMPARRGRAAPGGAHTNIWELREAKRKLKARGEKRRAGRSWVDQAQLIQAVNRLKKNVEGAAERTKQARRKSQRRKEHERKHAAEGAENNARAAQTPALALDPLDEQPEAFGRW